jgi:hypothetical protein
MGKYERHWLVWPPADFVELEVRTGREDRLTITGPSQRWLIFCAPEPFGGIPVVRGRFSDAGE